MLFEGRDSRRDRGKPVTESAQSLGCLVKFPDPVTNPQQSHRHWENMCFGMEEIAESVIPQG